MGDETRQELSLRGLQNAAGFLQAKIAERIDIRYTPKLSFLLDQGVKRSIAVAANPPAGTAAQAARGSGARRGGPAESAAPMKPRGRLPTPIRKQLDADVRLQECRHSSARNQAAVHCPPGIKRPGVILMTAVSRTAQFAKVHKTLKKHYKPVARSATVACWST